MDNFSRADQEALLSEADFYEHQRQEEIAGAGYDRGFQAGADAARRESAEIAAKFHASWESDQREHYWREAADQIKDAIINRVGQPVKETPDDK